MPQFLVSPTYPQRRSQIQKKTELSTAEKSRKETIIQIQSYLAQGYSSKAICEMMHTTYRQIRKFAKGDPDILCRRNKSTPPLSRSSLNQFRSVILEQLALKVEIRSIYKLIVSMGHNGKPSYLYDYCKDLVRLHDMNSHTDLNILGVKRDRNKPKDQYIERSKIFKYLWSSVKLQEVDITFLLITYPILDELKECISDFRNIYLHKSIKLLEEFVDKYSMSSNNNVKSFASGLAKDFEAVKNSVTSPYSNGFIEGNNNRLKMIKRTMYGRASLNLLRAKIVH